MYAKLKKQTKNKKEINAWQIELNDYLASPKIRKR